MDLEKDDNPFSCKNLESGYDATVAKRPPMSGRTLRFPAEMLEYLEREAKAYETDLSEIVRQHIRKTKRKVDAGEPLFEKAGKATPEVSPAVPPSQTRKRGA